MTTLPELPTPKSGQDWGLVCFDVSWDFIIDHAGLFARMMNGFIPLHTECNASRKVVTYFCWHAEAPNVVGATSVPVSEWVILDAPDRVTTWGLNIGTGKLIAQGSMPARDRASGDTSHATAQARQDVAP